MEATLPDMDIELSQGSHFFHNLTSLQLYYFNIRRTGPCEIDWEWLEKQKVISETDIKHLKIIRDNILRFLKESSEMYSFPL